MNKEYLQFHSPFGEILVISHKDMITGVHLSNSKHLPLVKDLKYNPENPVLQEAKNQLEEYINGNRQSFNIKYSLAGTEFQTQVWNIISKIPFGQTLSYSQIATMIDKPKSSRAVGNATGKNPISIIIPCHRVLRADNSIGGYASGVNVKRKILSLEKKELVS